MLLTSLLIALAAAPPSVQRDEPPPATRQEASTVPLRRSDLARCYRMLDRAVVDASRAEAIASCVKIEVNKAVDGAALAFFSGRSTEALATLIAMTAKVRGYSEAERATFVGLASYRGAIEPTVSLAGQDGAITLGLEALTAAARLPSQASIVITDPRGVRTSHILRGPGPIKLKLGASGPALEGRYEIALGGAGLDELVPLVSAPVLREEPMGLRTRLARRLDDLDAAGLGRAQDRSATRSRLGLIGADEAKSAVFLADQASLAREVGREIDAIAAGDSPWIGRSGDAWRTVRAGTVDFPVRVFVPVAKAGAKRPLIIALHGAGGDENMFFDGYGGGLLKQLADERGAVVACPPTVAFMVTPNLFDALVEEMEACHGIDRSSVLVLGHSLGAGAASRLSAFRGDRICAVALIAGSGSAAKEAPPTLVVAAGLDPLVPIERVRAQAAKAREEGARVTFLEYPDDGHLLVVTTALPKVVEWLLSQERSPAPVAAPSG